MRGACTSTWAADIPAACGTTERSSLRLDLQSEAHSPTNLSCSPGKAPQARSGRRTIQGLCFKGILAHITAVALALLGAQPTLSRPVREAPANETKAPTRMRLQAAHERGTGGVGQQCTGATASAASDRQGATERAEGRVRDDNEQVTRPRAFHKWRW
jgi:hypothetical protein